MKTSSSNWQSISHPANTACPENKQQRLIPGHSVDILPTITTALPPACLLKNYPS